MDLSIIIVNWNSVEYLKACIASVRRETSGIEYEIVVIDSGSFDGCDAMLERTYPDIRFVQSERNIGFGQANNMAVGFSRGRSLLFLNPDTEIRGAAVAAMYEWLGRLPDAGGVGCRLLNSDGSVQTSCVQAFPTIANQVLDAEWLRVRWQRSGLWGIDALFATDSAPKVVQTVAGACVMMKREVFDRVGGFSSEYFMYAEDVDLCYKIAALGLKVYYLPEATIVHHGGGSSNEAPSSFSVVLMHESICLFLKKQRGRAYAGCYRLAMLASALLRLAVLRLQLRRRAHDDGFDSSRRKWKAILEWSLWREATVRRLQPLR